MKVYIAGPIAGYEDLNRKQFESAVKILTELGHKPVNPHDVPPLDHGDAPCKGEPTQNNGHSYGCYMIPDLQALLTCDGYTLLPGWEKSKGAVVEQQVAKICGLTLIDVFNVNSSREEFYDGVRDRFIIRVTKGERSIQMSYSPKEYKALTPLQLDMDYQLLENKLRLADA